MMPPSIIKPAINEVLAALGNGRNAYVHCKSGKGRSATIVVGARTE